MSFAFWDKYRVHLEPFYVLQYPIAPPANPDSFPHSSYYTAGKLDICILVSCIAVMAILRDAFRLAVFEPLARWKLSRDLRKKRRRAAQRTVNSSPNGKESNPLTQATLPAVTTKELRQLNHNIIRFAEQGWSFVYYSLNWSFGLYVHLQLPTQVLSPEALWIGYPHIPLAAPLKFYYLTQTAFYLHQILILNAEARRKDHVQMMTHHIITTVLMLTSYFTNFTRVGCIIMVLMDWCDIILPLAKMIRYLDISQLLCDCLFGIFMISWFVTRHILFVIVIKSTLFDGPKHIEFGWDLEKGHAITRSAFYTFAVLLMMLEVLQAVWFVSICRVAWGVVRGTGAKDERSDDEGGDSEDVKDE